jgi:flagellum-specific peptidoglycan hydrolase FlgJ
MPAKCVPVRQTNYSQLEMTRAFIKAWIEIFDQLPEKRQIAIIWAQNTLETGHTKNMFNNNIGNIKYIPSPGDTEDIEYTMLAKTWEIINGKREDFNPPHPQTWFRSFETLSDGIIHHINFLRNKRYKNVWKAIDAGDPALFAKLLKQQGYYTASEESYRKVITSLFNDYMKNPNFENIIKEFNSEITLPEITLIKEEEAPTLPQQDLTLPPEVVAPTNQGLFSSIISFIKKIFSKT